MARKTVSAEHTKRAEFSKLVQRFKTDLDVAQSHSLGRDRRVGQVMCYLSLMRGADIISSNANIVCKKAIRQHFKSSRAEGKQAAHFLPGQLWVNNRCPWVFISDHRTARSFECLFGDAEDLPSDFNKADSAAEAYSSGEGLKHAFAASCKIVVQAPHLAEQDKISRLRVRLAYKDWIVRSRLAYRNALAQKTAKVNVPPLRVGPPGGTEYNMLYPDNLQARHTAMDKLHPYLAQAEFLKQYLATASIDNLSEFTMHKIEKNFIP